ncbi:hypothetical protein [Cupriavidus basilensis]|uniref:hypothetical protein n=1 Tax=Cupriavidus basilensis TaxID=68895 RepID=UPI0023E8AEDA|nr:hypothetical protein [Cupriavidus basilensis]MDF3883181.1 hypothetical protein [Cupriavidus basilensis]
MASLTYECVTLAQNVVWLAVFEGVPDGPATAVAQYWNWNWNWNWISPDNTLSAAAKE